MPDSILEFNLPYASHKWSFVAVELIASYIATVIWAWSITAWESRTDLFLTRRLRRLHVTYSPFFCRQGASSEQNHGIRCSFPPPAIGNCLRPRLRQRYAIHTRLAPSSSASHWPQTNGIRVAQDRSANLATELINTSEATFGLSILRSSPFTSTYVVRTP